MISPVWFAFNGIGSIFNLILRLPQYASVSKMINGTRFVNVVVVLGQFISTVLGLIPSMGLLHLAGPLFD